MNLIVMKYQYPHHGQPETPSAGVTLVAATNIHLHGRGQREGWFATRKRPRPTPSPGFWPYLTTFHGIVQNDISNRIERYSKSYRTISQIVQNDIQNRIERYLKSYRTISQIVQYDIPNRIERYFKSYRTIFKIVQNDIQNRIERYSTTGENGVYCSFLILVDYTFVLNLDKVDSVKH